MQVKAQSLRLQGSLQEKIESITKSFRQGYETEMEATPIDVELCLQELLAPWYTVATLQSRGDKGGLEFVIYPFGNTYYENRNNIPQYRFWMWFITLLGVERNVDRIRSQIIAGE